MPITPFHFGHGLLFRGISRHVSLSAFVVANCLIDIEPILGFLLNGDPAHRFMHTYLGATLAAIVTAFLTRPYAERWLRYWNTKLSPAQAKWMGCQETIPVAAYWIGAFVGAWSHVWLDAFMHVDVEAWWPMATGNDMQGAIDMTALHALCVTTGLAGLLLLGLQRIKANLPRVFTAIKWSGGLVGLSITLYYSYFLYSLDTGRVRVTDLCVQMKPGMPLDELILLAKEHGLGPRMPKPDARLVYLAELRSYGRHACRVELENGVVTSATYNYAD